MNKRAELIKFATMYVACRGILRIKLAAQVAQQPVQQQPVQQQPVQQQQATQPTTQQPTAGVNSNIVPTQQPKKRSWGQTLQDWVDRGNEWATSNYEYDPVKEQMAKEYNDRAYNKGLSDLANGEFTYDPSRRARAEDVSVEEMEEDKDYKPDEEKSGNGTPNITIHNNIPGYDSSGGTAEGDPRRGGVSYDAGSMQQYDSGPGLASWIREYSKYRNNTR